jgi:integrase
MEVKRQGFQFGWIDLKARKNGPDVWVLRYRETLQDGRKKERSVSIGTIQEFPSASLARKASLSYVLSMNNKQTPGLSVPFGALMQRYLAEELPVRHSTASRYRCWLKNHIEPKWRDFSIHNIKPLLVEDWLKKLDLAPKSKAHLKTLMHVLFNAVMRWELIPYQHNPMSLVRVKDSSKRLKEPKLLTAQEFCALLEHIPEPFRTMCIVAMCLGLRVSEVLGLKWTDIDWDGLRIAIRQAYVYGRQGDVKTRASQKWMPLDPSLAEKDTNTGSGLLRDQTMRTGSSPIPRQANPIGLDGCRRIGLSPLRKSWGSVESDGTLSGIAIPPCFTRWESISRCNRSYCGMRMFERL